MNLETLSTLHTLNRQASKQDGLEQLYRTLASLGLLGKQHFLSVFSQFNQSAFNDSDLPSLSSAEIGLEDLKTMFCDVSETSEDALYHFNNYILAGVGMHRAIYLAKQEIGELNKRIQQLSGDQRVESRQGRKEGDGSERVINELSRENLELGRRLSTLEEQHYRTVQELQSKTHQLSQDRSKGQSIIAQYEERQRMLESEKLELLTDIRTRSKQFENTRMQLDETLKSFRVLQERTNYSSQSLQSVNFSSGIEDFMYAFDTLYRNVIEKSSRTSSARVNLEEELIYNGKQKVLKLQEAFNCLQSTASHSRSRQDDGFSRSLNEHDSISSPVTETWEDKSYLTQELQQTRLDLDKKDQQMEELRCQIDELEARLNSVNNEKKTLIRQLSRKQSEVVFPKSRIDERGQITQIFELIDGTLEVAFTHEEEKNIELKEKFTQIKSIISEHEGLSQSHRELNQEKQLLQIMLDSVTNKLRSQQGEISMLNRQLDNMRTEVSDLMKMDELKQLDKMKRDTEKLKKDLAASQAENQELHRALDKSYEARRSEYLPGRRQSAFEKQSSHEQKLEKTELQARNRESTLREDKIIRLEEGNAHLTAEIQTLEKQVQQLKSMLHKKEQELDSLQEEVAKLSEINERFEPKFRNIQGEDLNETGEFFAMSKTGQKLGAHDPPLGVLLNRVQESDDQNDLAQVSAAFNEVLSRILQYDAESQKAQDLGAAIDSLLKVEHEVNRLREENDIVNSTMQQLQEQSKQQLDDFDEQQTRFLEAEKQVEQMNSTIQQLRHALDTSHEEGRKLAQRIRDLEKEHEHKDGAIRRLKQELLPMEICQEVLSGVRGDLSEIASTAQRKILSHITEQLIALNLQGSHILAKLLSSISLIISKSEDTVRDLEAKLMELKRNEITKTLSEDSGKPSSDEPIQETGELISPAKRRQLENITSNQRADTELEDDKQEDNEEHNIVVEPSNKIQRERAPETTTMTSKSAVANSLPNTSAKAHTFGYTHSISTTTPRQDTFKQVQTSRPASNGEYGIRPSQKDTTPRYWAENNQLQLKSEDFGVKREPKTRQNDHNNNQDASSSLRSNTTVPASTLPIKIQTPNQPLKNKAHDQSANQTRRSSTEESSKHKSTASTDKRSSFTPIPTRSSPEQDHLKTVDKRASSYERARPLYTSTSPVTHLPDRKCDYHQPATSRANFFAPSTRVQYTSNTNKTTEQSTPTRALSPYIEPKNPKSSLPSSKSSTKCEEPIPLKTAINEGTSNTENQRYQAHKKNSLKSRPQALKTAEYSTAKTSKQTTPIDYHGSLLHQLASNTRSPSSEHYFAKNKLFNKEKKDTLTLNLLDPKKSDLTYLHPPSSVLREPMRAFSYQEPVSSKMTVGNMGGQPSQQNQPQDRSTPSFVRADSLQLTSSGKLHPHIQEHQYLVERSYSKDKERDDKLKALELKAKKLVESESNTSQSSLNSSNALLHDTNNSDHLDAIISRQKQRIKPSKNKKSFVPTLKLNELQRDKHTLRHKNSADRPLSTKPDKRRAVYKPEEEEDAAICSEFIDRRNSKFRSYLDTEIINKDQAYREGFEASEQHFGEPNDDTALFRVGSLLNSLYNLRYYVKSKKENDEEYMKQTKSSRP